MDRSVFPVDCSRRVLVVDDESSIRLSLQLLLSDEGFEVSVAEDAAQAEVLLAQSEFGVAIVDKNMPGSASGLELLARARDRYPDLKIILHTGFPSTDSAVMALRAGAFDYLSKPTSADLVVEKVRRAAHAYKVARSRKALFRDYEDLFEAVPGVVWFLTKGGVFTRVSKQCAALLEYEPDEIIGQSYEHFLDPSSLGPEARWTFNERRTGSRATRRRVITMRAKSGAKRTLELSSAAAYDPGKNRAEGYRGTLVIGVDITDQVGLLNQLQERSKMDALGRMAGGVAHDFNNALSAITGSIEYLRDEMQPQGELDEALRDVEESADRAADMTRQLLLFSRRNSDEAAVLDPKDVLESTLRMMRRVIRADVDFDIQIEEHIGRVRMDKTKLSQVLMNLGVNAGDAMPNGGRLLVTLRNVVIDDDYASAHAQLVPGEYVQLAVTDSGSGISSDVQQRLFEPFFTTKEPGQGTGLGLSIVYGIVKQIGGHVTVYSEEEIGTTFRVYLPRAYENAAQSESRAPMPPRQGGGTVLLAEDDHVVRRVARRILSRHGYRVFEACDGARALETWNEHGPFDAVVTDVVMAKMGGAELGIRLRELSSELPIVYVSGYLGQLGGDHALLKERALLVEKPFTERAIIGALRRVIDGPNSPA